MNDGSFSLAHCCFRSVRMPSRISKMACLCTTQKTTLVWRTPGISSKLRYTYKLNFWSVVSAQHKCVMWSFLVLLIKELGLDISIKAPIGKKCFWAFEFQKTNHKPWAACGICWFMIENSWSEKLLGKTKEIVENCRQAFCPFTSAE